MRQPMLVAGKQQRPLVAGRGALDVTNLNVSRKLAILGAIAGHLKRQFARTRTGLALALMKRDIGTPPSTIARITNFHAVAVSPIGIFLSQIALAFVPIVCALRKTIRSRGRRRSRSRSRSRGRRRSRSRRQQE